MPDLQKLLPKTSCHDLVVTGEVSQAQYEEAPCQLSDTHDEDIDIEPPYLYAVNPINALPE